MTLSEIIAAASADVFGWRGFIDVLPDSNPFSVVPVSYHTDTGDSCGGVEVVATVLYDDGSALEVAPAAVEQYRGERYHSPAEHPHEDGLVAILVEKHTYDPRGGGGTTRTLFVRWELMGVRREDVIAVAELYRETRHAFEAEELVAELLPREMPPLLAEELGKTLLWRCYNSMWGNPIQPHPMFPCPEG